MDLTKIAELANPIITTLLGSSGIWMWAKTRSDRNNSEDQLLLEVAKNQLTVLGRSYLERGYIHALDKNGQAPLADSWRPQVAAGLRNCFGQIVSSPTSKFRSCLVVL